jgi:hypothetical protein
MQFTVGKKRYYNHRAVYEVFNGLIEKGRVIDHIDSNPLHNNLSNLQAISQSENNKRGLTGKCSKQPRPVVSFDITTDERRFFQSINAAGKHFDIHPSSVQKVAEGIYKTAISKKSGNRIKFSYSNDESQ